MTGRDGGAELAPIANSPVVILVRPQLADNIGACARAMANGGLFHLRLVAPRDGWPQEKAWRNASGADRILDAATVFASVPDAVADLHRVFATCPRPRHIIKPVLTARGAAAELHEIGARGLRAGVLFGPERAGLDNDDMAQADALVRYPLNPAFMSLNLAQAVMVLAYEWWIAADTTPPRALMTNETQVATKGELENFLTHLVDQLDACGFLRNLPKRPGMVRNIRHFFQRGEVTEQELRTLHGIVTELAIGRRQMGRLEDGGLIARLRDGYQALLQCRISLSHLDRLLILLHRQSLIADRLHHFVLRLIVQCPLLLWRPSTGHVVSIAGGSSPHAAMPCRPFAPWHRTSGPAAMSLRASCLVPAARRGSAADAISRAAAAATARDAFIDIPFVLFGSGGSAGDEDAFLEIGIRLRTGDHLVIFRHGQALLADHADRRSLNLAGECLPLLLGLRRRHVLFQGLAQLYDLRDRLADLRHDLIGYIAALQASVAAWRRLKCSSPWISPFRFSLVQRTQTVRCAIVLRWSPEAWDDRISIKGRSRSVMSLRLS